MRFPGFTEEWETKKLGEIGEIITGSTPPTNEESYYVGEYLFVSPADIQANRHVESTRTTLTEKGFKKGRKIRKGSSLFVCIGSTIGKIGQAKEDCITNQQINSVVSFNMEDDFVFSLLEFHSARIKLLSAEQAVPIINKTTFSNVEVNTPCIKEQQKIGSFLSFLDSRIQTQNKIIKQLQTLIKGVSKKLFSQKIRFIDFTEKWEMKTFGKIATFYSGGTPLTSKKDYFDGNIPFIRSGEINSDKTEQFISELGLKNSSAKIVEVGDILYALYGATSGEVGISRIKGAINQAVLCIRSTENHYFLYSYLVYKKESIIKTFLQGGQGNLSADIVKQLKINLPSLEEQRRIASFLSKIHQKIQTEEAILEQLNNQKQYLLKQLFV